MNNKNLNKKGFIFQFKDIDNQIHKLEDDLKTSDNSNNIESRINELKIFKEFTQNILERTNEHFLDDYFIGANIKLCNVNSKDASDAEFDIYFINKINYQNKNKFIIFIFEIKDYTKNYLQIFKSLEFENDWHILKQNLKLTYFIFPMFNTDCIFLKTDIFKSSSNLVELKFVHYLYSWNNDSNKWEKKDLSIDEFIKSFLLNTKNINLHDTNINSLTSTYDEDFIQHFLYNPKNIKKAILNIENIWNLKDQNLKNKKIIRIEGTPGSGKTIFALSLFMTEKEVVLIVTNKTFFNDNKDFLYVYEIDDKLRNCFMRYVSNTFSCTELKIYKTIIIDEYQTIKIDQLKEIFSYCKQNNKILFILGDKQQDIYWWLNHNNFKLDKKPYKKGKNKINDKIDEIINDIWEESEILNLDWIDSNRLSANDLKKIHYLVYGKHINGKDISNDNSELVIHRCKSDNLLNIQKTYKNILFVSTNNEPGFLTPYQYIGYEFDHVVIYFSKWFRCINDQKNRVNICINKNNNWLQDSKTILPFLYVSFTRATKSIRIFVDENNPDKENICKYFNDRIDELNKNNTKN